MTLFRDKYNILIFFLYLLVLLSFYFFNLTNYDKVILYIVNFYLCLSLGIIFFLLNRKRKGFSLKEIIFIALALRITLLFVSPITSGDYYRYLWDGRIQTEGINPFQYAPEELTQFHDEIIYPKVTYPDLKTIYPPLAQIVFFLSYNISETSALGFKIFYLLFETGIIFFLYKILCLLRVSPVYIFFYVLSPLVIFEFFINAHIDIVLLFFLSASIFFVLKKNINLSFLFLGFSVLSKVYTLIFLPVYLIYFLNLNFNYKKMMSGLAFFAVSFLIILIYQSHINEMFFIFRNYLQNWYSNNLVYVIINSFNKTLGFDNHQLTRIVLMIFFLVSYALILKSKFTFIQKLYLISFFYLFFSSTVHQWYVILLVLFLPVCFSYSALYWSGIIGFTNATIYFYLKNNIWEDILLVLILEYSVLAVLIFLDMKRFKLERSDVKIE